MKNIYFDKLQESLHNYVDDFIRLRSATLTQLQLDLDTLKNPRASMKRTFGQALELAYALKQKMLTEAKQILASEKYKLSATAETTVLKELKKLNDFYDFQNRLSYMSMNEMHQFSNDDNLTETEVHQIKAELAHRRIDVKSDQERTEIEDVIQSIKFISPLDRLEEASNALEQLRIDKNAYPFLPAHLAMDNNIPRLLGADMLSGLGCSLFIGEET